MGLFGLFGKSSKSVDPTIAWLSKVDAEYMKAFQVKNVTGLADYLTRPCLARVMEQVRLGEKMYAGISRYRHTDWKKVSDTETESVYTKYVTYDDVRMSHGVTVPVGDRVTEKWILVLDNLTHRVSDIRRIQNA